MKILKKLSSDKIKTKYFVEYSSFYLDRLASKLGLTKSKKATKSTYYIEQKKVDNRIGINVTLVSKYLRIQIFPAQYNSKTYCRFLLVSCKSVTPKKVDGLGFNNLISLPTLISEEDRIVKRIKLLQTEYKLEKIKKKYFLSDSKLRTLKNVVKVKDKKQYKKDFKTVEAYLKETLPYYCKYYVNNVHSHFNNYFCRLKDLHVGYAKTTKDITESLALIKYPFKELAKKLGCEINKELGIFSFYDKKNELLYSSVNFTLNSMIYVYRMNKESRKKFVKLCSKNKEGASDFFRDNTKLINILLVR